MQRIAILIAAAGASRRLGRAKQLIPFRGRTLLRHAAETALAAKLGPVHVVLGASGEECRRALDGLDVFITLNDSWPEGLGGSIACGMEALRELAPDAVIVMLCDQPAVTPQTLSGLTEAQRSTGADIVASAYDGTNGVPALFVGNCFPQLLSLRGQSGAKSLFSGNNKIETVPFPGGALDIDTPEQLARLDLLPYSGHDLRAG